MGHHLGSGGLCEASHGIAKDDFARKNWCRSHPLKRKWKQPQVLQHVPTICVSLPSIYHFSLITDARITDIAYYAGFNEIVPCLNHSHLTFCFFRILLRIWKLTIQGGASRQIFFEDQCCAQDAAR